jgi:hypothetical protein
MSSGKLIYISSTSKHKMGDIVDGIEGEFDHGYKFKIFYGSGERDYIIYDSSYPVMDLERWRDLQINKLIEE